MATLVGQDQNAQSVGQEMARDDVLREDSGALLREAAERVTFHSIELERWQRVGRATAAALREVEMCSSVAQASPDDFMQTKGAQTTPF